jgi:hypothetical protein
VRADGAGLRKATESTVVNLFGAYPNRKWLLIGMVPFAEVIFPATGGTPIVLHLGPPTVLRWMGDGKYLFVVGAAQRRANTYVLPLSPGEVLPASISRAQNFPSEAGWQSYPECKLSR